MADGPRDWSPPGYWDVTQPSAASKSPVTRVAQPHKRVRSGLYALLSVALGLIACWLPLSLAAADSGYRGWAVTTIGLTAVGFAIAAARARAARGKSAGVVSVLGGSLGVVGTVLCLWCVAAFYFSSIPPIPTLASITGQSALLAPSVTGPIAATPTAPGTSSARIVAPIAGADVVAPALQLHANVRHVALGLCVGVSSTVQVREQYGDAFDGLPLSLTVGPDGTVSAGKTTFSKLPADMRLEYSATPEGVFRLTVRDAQSGLGVGCDSGSNRLVDR